MTSCRSARYGIVGFAALRIKPLDHVIGKLAQFIQAIVRVEVLEVPETHETRRDPCHNGGGFDSFAAHRLIRTDDAQRPRGRNAEMVHGFGAQIFAYG